MIRNSLLLALLALLVSCVVAMSFAPPNMGGAVGCVVTANRLFSHSNYIRDLSDAEMKQLKEYKKGMKDFKKKIDEAFENAEKLEATNSTAPPMPTKPAMPSFCTGSDTVMYIFGGCTIQNNKVYVGKTFARELDQTEQSKLADITTKMAKNGGAPPADLSIEFCTEF